MKTILIHLLGEIILFSSLLIVSTFSQNTFIKTYPGIAGVGHSIIQTADSGYAVFGHTSQNQAVFVKTDKNGDTLCVKHYGNEHEYPAFAYKIKETLDGGYFLGYGNTLIKTENNGAIIWTYDFNLGDIIDIDVTLDTCVAISGSMYQKPADTLYYFYVSKIDNSGQVLWLRNYIPLIYSIPFVKDVQATYDSGFIILADLWPSGGYFQVLKTDMNGDTMWSKMIGGFRNVGNSIVETNDSSYFITAFWTEKPCEYCELFIHTWALKLDKNGDTIWTKKYIFDIEDGSSIGKQTKDGAYFLTGYKYTIETTRHLFVGKLNGIGDTVWTKTLLDKNFIDSKGYDIVETFDGGYAVTGSVTYSNDQKDMLLLKLDKDGNITSVNDKERDLVPQVFSLQQNYPNPFNPITTINYQLPKESYVTLRVFDVLGNQIAELVNGYQSAGNYEVNFPSINLKLASGTYFFRIQANDFVQTKKMTLLK
ncbi:MAG: T9SS type A sorting domain-containing protein [Ignavibacteriaceae bacterium]|nr:T9SS type A sorting domain-containing protein [Ignavibacteriaceae bacterium]